MLLAYGRYAREGETGGSDGIDQTGSIKGGPIVALLLTGLFVLVYVPFFWFLALFAVQLSSAWRRCREGHFTEAVVVDEKSSPSGKVKFVQLRYTSCTTPSHYITGVEDEIASIENLKWKVLPQSLRQFRVSESVPILVHPTDPNTIQFVCKFEEMIDSLIRGIFLALVVCVVCVVMGFLFVSHVEVPGVPHGRAFSVALLTCVYTGLSTCVYAMVRHAHQEEDQGDGYVAAERNESFKRDEQLSSALATV